MLQWLTFMDGSGQATPVDGSRHGGLPRTIELEQNYPNPFNPGTKIGYRLQAIGNSWVRLDVYDILRREVAVLVNESQESGAYDVRFDAAGLASGAYLYRLTVAENVQTRTMVLAK